VSRPFAPKLELVHQVPVVIESSDAVPLVNLTLYSRRGAATEPDGADGLCRLTMRLMRRTASGIPLLELERRLDRLGAQLSADANASATALLTTCVSRSLDQVLELLAGASTEPSLAEEEFERLRRETLAELIESRDNDRVLCARALRHTLFGAHPYGRNLTGTVESLRRLDHAQVRAFHDQAFSRGELLLSIAGDISRDRALAAAETLLGRHSEHPASPRDLADPTPIEGRRVVIVDKPGRTQCQTMIGLLGARPDDPDHTALMVANTVFGGTFSSRLMNEVRSKRGWSYSAYATLGLERRRHALTLWTTPDVENAAACVALELELLERLVRDGITRRELGAAKRTLTRSHAFAIDTAGKRAALSVEVPLLGLPEDTYSRYVERINAVTLEQANAALAARLDPARLVVAQVGSAAELGPALAQKLGATTPIDVIPYDSESL